MSLSWLEFPSELRHAILQRLSLPQLRLLKAVSRAMANNCRAVLRSEAWQEIPINLIALEAELKSLERRAAFVAEEAAHARASAAALSE